MRKPRVALVVGLTLTTAILAILASAQPAAEATPTGRCQSPQKLAIVSPNGDVELATSASHVPGGWRVVCWPSPFYAGTVRVVTTSKSASSTIGPDSTLTQQQSSREDVDYAVLFRLKSASISTNGESYADYSLARPRRASGFAMVSFASSDSMEMKDSLCQRSTLTTTEASGLPALEHGELYLRNGSGVGGVSAGSVPSNEVEKHTDSPDCGGSPTFTSSARFTPTANSRGFGGNFTGGHYEVMKGTRNTQQKTAEGSSSVTVIWNLKGLLEPATLTPEGGSSPPSLKGGQTLRSPLAHVLAGDVGDSTISIQENGRLVQTLTAGHVVLVVMDHSAKQSFHLKGPGTDMSTGVGWLGTKTWNLVLQKGTYRVFSDGPAPKLSTSFKVT